MYIFLRLICSFLSCVAVYTIRMVFVLIFYAGRPWTTGLWNNFTHNVFRSLCTRYTSIALFRLPIFYLIVGGGFGRYSTIASSKRPSDDVLHMCIVHNPIQFTRTFHFRIPSVLTWTSLRYWYRVIVLVSVLMVCTRTKRLCASSLHVPVFTFTLNNDWCISPLKHITTTNALSDCIHYSSFTIILMPGVTTRIHFVHSHQIRITTEKCNHFSWVGIFFLHQLPISIIENLTMLYIVEMYGKCVGQRSNKYQTSMS